MTKEYIWFFEDIKKVNKNNLKVFSCFSCGGGSCMGYKLAGFDVIGNNEIDEKINEIYIKNHNPKYNFCCDIRDLLNLDLPNDLYNLDILDGSPPCSVFSMVGKREKFWGVEKKFREGQKKQRLDDLFFSFINLADKLKPKIVVSENVKGLIFKKARGYVNEILKAFDKAGYETQIFILNSAQMGVPQTRERIFFISKRKDLNLPNIFLNFNEKPIKYKDFKDTEHFVPFNKQSEDYKIWFKRKYGDKSIIQTKKRISEDKGGFFTLNRYIYDDKVCGTLVPGCDRFVRFDVPGKISDRDIAIIQTFPLDYNFCGQSPVYICGMSVPPIMMKKIAQQIYFQLLKEK